MTTAPPSRRHALVRGVARALAAWLALGPGGALRAAAQGGDATLRRWYEAALAQRRRAESWGDQPYGAVLVLDGQLVGEGPSRVVQRNDPDAHAERVALADAQQRLGRRRLDGSVLVSTSRPCALCEAAAAAAGVSRMVWGEALNDAGAPRPGPR